jgi:hypothetical protein
VDGDDGAARCIRGRLSVGGIQICQRWMEQVEALEVDGVDRVDGHIGDRWTELIGGIHHKDRTYLELLCLWSL